MEIELIDGYRASYFIGPGSSTLFIRGPEIRLLEREVLEKYRIRETKHISTDADSSIHTTVGWTKNNQKPNYFEKRKKSSKTQKLKNV